jgi:hypothetical protein
VLAAAALALPAAAQNTQTAPAARPDPPKQDRPAAERPAAGTQDAGQAQRPQQPAQRPDPAQPNSVPAKDDIMKKLAGEEAKHRETVAKIDRLRELAQQKGDNERLTQLADMLKRENDRYAALRTKARAALGDDTFNAMEKRLAQGRGRGAAAGDQAAARDRAAQQKPDAGQAARKPDQQQQRPAQPGQQRQGAPKADSDTKPAAPAERPKGNNNKRQAQANTGTQQPAAGGQRGSNPK